MKKPFYKSKIFWQAIIVFITGIIAVINKDYAIGITGIITGIGIIISRWNTDKKLTA